MSIQNDPTLAGARPGSPPLPVSSGLRVIASLPTATLVVDAQGIILMANRRAARILERGAEALCGASFTACKPPCPFAAPPSSETSPGPTVGTSGMSTGNRSAAL